VILLVESTFEPNITIKSVGQALRAHLRVLKLTKKPSREEFLTIAKVAGIGILAVGAIGFIVYVLLTMLPQWVAK
jgi:protein transport protein SEC61 subunit gamma and related proteins